VRGRGDHGRRWYLFDGLGSVLAEVSPTGTITSSRNYEVYGNVRSGVNANGTSAHKFVGNLGHPSDNNTGLIYMQARYMDPATGRFVSEDPGRDGTNWFAYCDANPVYKVDVNGEFPLTNITSFLLLIVGAFLIATVNNWDPGDSLNVQLGLRIIRGIAGVILLLMSLCQMFASARQKYGGGTLKWRNRIERAIDDIDTDKKANGPGALQSILGAAFMEEALYLIDIDLQ